jgi:hypothetical protein
MCAAGRCCNNGASGTIVHLRLYTVSWSSPPSAHDVAAFQLSPAIGGGCVWAWVDPTDDKALAMVISAKATGASVAINVDNAVPSPWGDSSMCVLQLISLWIEIPGGGRLGKLR